MKLSVLIFGSLMNDQQAACELCGVARAQRYQLFNFGALREPAEIAQRWLCAPCARTERRNLQAQPPAVGGLTRDELIGALDRFFAASGMFEICRRCHQQNTGCCPPSCRLIGPQGCQGGKPLYCATFLCSALLNAISECEPELGRLLKWLKSEVGVAEWRVYEMFTRVPAAAREPERPLALPLKYPDPGELDGAALRARLLVLADEVLEVRRRWHAQEHSERAAL